jgi:exodeoxyribonuclease VII small subunit
MPSKPKDENVDYQAMSAELEAILLELQGNELDIETAVQKYERGLKLIAALETYLKTAENRVTKLKAEFDKGESKAGD